MQFIFALKKDGRYQEVLLQVERLRDEGVRTADLAVHRADALARLGRPVEALEGLESVRLEYPSFSPFGRALLGGLLLHAGREEEARKEFEQLAGETTLSVGVATRVAQFFQEDERVVPMLERWAQETPDWYRLRGRYGSEAHRTAVLKRGHERFPDDESLFEDYALVRLKHLPPEVIAEELESLLRTRIHADSLRLRERLAQSLRALGENERALELLLECARRAPHSRSAYYLANVGYVYRDLGQIERALDFLGRAIEAGDRIAVNAFLKTCREHGQSQRAMDFFRQRAERDSKDLTSFLTACKDAGQRELAHDFVATRAATDRRLWGAYTRVFRPAAKKR